jgi:ssDNA thymidine ADP-ribosyltransferase, DarT
MIYVKQRRLKRAVKVGIGGKLGDYVPFNFCNRSVMLYTLSKSHEDYNGGQDEIVHLVSSVQTAVALGKPWAFTDRHADLGYAMYFTSLSNLSEVNWNVMPLTYWADSDNREQRKNIREQRQAEFLVHNSFPWSAIEHIGVKNAAVKARVQALLPSGAPPVAIQTSWYY